MVAQRAVGSVGKTRGAQGRLTSGLYAGTAIVLVVAVVAVAYGATAPNLGIAEFAPTAKQALEAPPTTSGDESIASAAATARRRPTTTTTAPVTSAANAEASTSVAPTTRVSRARECFGDPPRQLADPESPPCATAIFEGDNGGASATGVSATEIRVGVANSGSWLPQVDALFEYFNRHFELYGRRLVPVYVTGNDAGPTGGRAVAADLAAKGIFAALGSGIEYGDSGRAASFFQELARDGVIGIAEGKGRLLTDREVFDQNHPYLWSVFPSAEQLWTNLSSFVCQSLAGRPASHAGTPELRATTRKFGVLAFGAYTVPRTQPLTDGLQACDVDPVVVSQERNAQPDLRVALDKFAADGVTTILCACKDSTLVQVIGAVNTAWASSGPELVMATYGETNVESIFQSYAGAASHLFGLMDRPKQLPWQTRGWYGAMQEINPALFAGANAASPSTSLAAGRVYEQLLVLASGIQGAGPTLTPDSFAAALMSTQFSNPGAGAEPYWQPAVGFGPGDHSFYNDVALVSWNPALESLEPGSQPRGSWCYVARGKRFVPGGYPGDADGQLFNAELPCR